MMILHRDTVESYVYRVIICLKIIKDLRPHYFGLMEFMENPYWEGITAGSLLLNVTLLLMDIGPYYLLYRDSSDLCSLVVVLTPRLPLNVLRIAYCLLSINLNFSRCYICRQTFRYELRGWRIVRAEFLECGCSHHASCVENNKTTMRPPASSLASNPPNEEQAQAPDNRVICRNPNCREPVSETVQKTKISIDHRIDQNLEEQIIDAQREASLGWTNPDYEALQWGIPMIIALFIFAIILGPFIHIYGKPGNTAVLRNATFYTIRVPPGNMILNIEKGEITRRQVNLSVKACPNIISPAYSKFVMYPLEVLLDIIIAIMSYRTENQRKYVRENVHFIIWNSRSDFVYLDTQNLNKHEWDCTKPKAFITHGWKPNQLAETWDNLHCSAILDIAIEYVKKGYEVVIVEWEVSAGTPNYYGAAKSTEIVGRKVGDVILGLQELNHTRLENTVLVGFSLGSHVMGVAGDQIIRAGKKVGHIIGIDPAQPTFTKNGKLQQEKSKVLDASDAAFVEILHCNAGFLGTDADLGTIDYYPNGGSTQPGCGGAIEIKGCSHSYCPKLFAKSFQKNFHACPCKNEDDFIAGQCKCVPGDGLGTPVGIMSRKSYANMKLLNEWIDIKGFVQCSKFNECWFDFDSSNGRHYFEAYIE